MVKSEVLLKMIIQNIDELKRDKFSSVGQIRNYFGISVLTENVEQKESQFYLFYSLLHS